MTARANRPALLAFLAASAAFLAYLPSFRHGWVFLDDQMFLMWNTGWRGLGLSNLRWDLTARVGGVYQPLSYLTYGLDFALGGMDARFYHAQSALWHAAAAGLFYFVARRLLAAVREDENLDFAALFATLFFALHPLRVESVAWATERRDVVCGAFYLATVLAWLSGRSRALVAGLFLLALAGKGMAMTLPVVLLILEVWPLRRKPDLREKLPLFALAGAFALIGTAVQHRMRWTWEQHGLAGRLAQACYSLVFYARKTLVPSGLLPLYELRPPVNPIDPAFLIAIAAVPAIAVLAWRRRREQPWWTAALAVYAVTLLPVSGLFQFGPQLVADRYSYLSCLPFAVVAGGGFQALLARARRPALAGAVALLAALLVATVVQQEVWRDTETLWRTVLAGDPASGMAHSGLGVILVERGEKEAAEAHFRAAIAAFPGCADDQDALAGLMARGDRDSEIYRRLSRRVETNPTCRKARADLGAVRAERGDLAEADRILTVVTMVSPWDDGARRNLGRVRALLARQPR